MSGFDKSETVRFKLIAEEAFVYVLKTSLSEEEKGNIKIKAQITDVNLILSFMDDGCA